MPKFVETVFKNSVPTSKKTQHFIFTKIKWLVLIQKTVAVYAENHMEPINTKCRVADCALTHVGYIRKSYFLNLFSSSRKCYKVKETQF
jgi:hypothetical protein